MASSGSDTQEIKTTIIKGTSKVSITFNSNYSPATRFGSLKSLVKASPFTRISQSALM
jgi:hypothetical protein